MGAIKNQQEILQKLKIEKLNPMQEEAGLAISSSSEVILLSPTGTGKTLAFLLPILKAIDPEIEDIQVLIIVPSRELALQIESVLREMGTGHKVNAIYGGRAGTKDKMEIKHRPAILIGTPGRIADHIRRDNFQTKTIHTLILDEFDKSLEVGFEGEMKEICQAIRPVKRKILTSATRSVNIPKFVGLQDPAIVNYLGEDNAQLTIKRILSPDKDKLQTLVSALAHLSNHPEPQPGIIFCNYKDTIDRVSDHLSKHKISHGSFYGGMEQKDRERALIQFRNGTHQLLLATDLAARGIDIPELKFILHYQLPSRLEEFTHRNGRTARMNKSGAAYLLMWEKDTLPEFIKEAPVLHLKKTEIPKPSPWVTLFISGGRKDKISKGDIAGTFIKQAKLDKDELGTIEIKQDCAFVAVSKHKFKEVIKLLDNTRIKKKKVRITKI
ncbi:MAG: DEAD/DEAH box helicase [Cyclobacteriaceae bacterium]